MKKIIIIAGPNGAGKTTFARSFLPAEANCFNFVNADLIAAGLSPFNPDKIAIKAAKLMLERLKELAINNESFCFETTLSGLSYIKHIKNWNTQGYHTSIYFLKLNSVEIAIQRVKTRVLQGEHDIPVDVIQRRFISGYLNFCKYYKDIVNEWALYENTDTEIKLLDWNKND
jgi:predicted ABC-type ATPase